MLWDLIKIASKKGLTWAVTIISFIFTFVQESFFGIIQLRNFSLFIVGLSCGTLDFNAVNITCNRLLLFVILWLFSMVISILQICCRKTIVIKSDNYIINVKCGDIFEETNCKKVISFDECFTTTIGNAPHEIKPTSICGQYLQANPNINMQQLIANAHLTKERGKSKFNRQDKYKSGSIVPNGDDFLLAFAPLDENGRGVFPSYKEYLDSLFLLWQELDKYYAQHDVCIPILGSGITRIGDGMGTFFSQQELLEMIIASYKLSPYKIKKPNKLRIICKKNEDFSLEKIKINQY